MFRPSLRRGRTSAALRRRASHRSGRAGFPRIAAAATAVAVLFGATACTSDDAAPIPIRTTVERVWTAVGIDPVSAVREVDGSALVYGSTSDGLLIHGLDPVDGKLLWSRPAALPTWDPAPIAVTSLDDAVAYFRPTGTDRLTQLVIADPRTGADRAVSAARYWRSNPGVCSDDDAWACLGSFEQSADGWTPTWFRVNRTTGDTRPYEEQPTEVPEGGTSLLVSDLYFSRDVGTDAVTIGQAKDGVPTWTRAAAELFGPAVTHPRRFWYSEPSDLDYTIMTVTGQGTGSGVDGVLDLAKDISTTAFVVDTGETRWAVPGSSQGCGLNPFLYWHRADSAKPATYLCRYTGSAIRDTDDDHLVTSNLQVTLDRIDPKTGVASWSRPMGDAKRLIGDVTGAESALLDDEHLYVPNSTGGLVIDLNSGETRGPRPEDTFWCGVSDSFPRPEPYFVTSTPLSTADRQGLVNPCRADGSSAPVPTTTIPDDIGATFDGGLRVIALAHEVAGFLTPPSAVDATATTSNSPNPTAAPSETAGTSEPAGAAATPIAPAITTVEQVWAATGFEARTTPRIIGGTAVGYGTVGRDLFLIGLDPATGAERWRRPASAAGLAPSAEVEVVQVDDLVAYLRPDDPSRPILSAVVMIDPATGTDKIASELRWWFTLPAICSDDPASLCASAHNVESDKTVRNRQFRINRQDAAVTLIPQDTPTDPAPYSTLWNDLVSINGTPDETVGIVKDQAVVWSKPLAELLGPGATLDYGWYASEDDGATPVLELSGRIGWTGAPGPAGTTYPSLDLASNLVTVGINRDDGSVLWRQPGTSPQCRYSLPGRHLISTPGSPYPAIRCRYSGRLDSSPPGRSYGLTVPTDLTVAVERVDLQSGEAIWSIPVGVAAPLAVASGGLATTFLDDHRLLVGNQVIDLDTGASRAPAPGETFWCPGRQSFDQVESWYGVDGSVRVDRSASGQVFTCDGHAQPTTSVPTGVPLAVSGVSDDGLRLVATPGGVVAYRVPR